MNELRDSSIRDPDLWVALRQLTREEMEMAYAAFQLQAQAHGCADRGAEGEEKMKIEITQCENGFTASKTTKHLTFADQVDLFVFADSNALFAWLRKQFGEVDRPATASVLCKCSGLQANHKGGTGRCSWDTCHCQGFEPVS